MVLMMMTMITRVSIVSMMTKKRKLSIKMIIKDVSYLLFESVSLIDGIG